MKIDIGIIALCIFLIAQDGVAIDHQVNSPPRILHVKPPRQSFLEALQKYQNHMEGVIVKTSQRFLMGLGISGGENLTVTQNNRTTDSDDSAEFPLEYGVPISDMIYDIFVASDESFTDSITNKLFYTDDISSSYPMATKKAMGKVNQNTAMWAKKYRREFGVKSRGNATLSTGGGFGFGFQVYCGCDLLLTTGMGHGGGFLVNNSKLGPVGGHGGGGGIQIYWNVGSPRLPFAVVNVGGGGGGELFGKQGHSAGPSQPAPSPTMVGTMNDVVLPQIKALCPKKVSIVGGGSGGFGFDLQTEEMKYSFGGGNVIQFQSQGLNEENKKCGGIFLKDGVKVKDENEKNSKNSNSSKFTKGEEEGKDKNEKNEKDSNGGKVWGKISDEMGQCRQKCVGKKYGACQCPCLKDVLKRNKKDFGKSMTCAQH